MFPPTHQTTPTPSRRMEPQPQPKLICVATPLWPKYAQLTSISFCSEIAEKAPDWFWIVPGGGPRGGGPLGGGPLGGMPLGGPDGGPLGGGPRPPGGPDTTMAPGPGGGPLFCLRGCCCCVGTGSPVGCMDAWNEATGDLFSSTHHHAG